MRAYMSTSEIARALGVHPNTVRLYERWGLIPEVPRSKSGYRQYSETHLLQMRLARSLLRWPYPGGKSQVLTVFRAASQGQYDLALEGARDFVARIQQHICLAERALESVGLWQSAAAGDICAAQRGGVGIRNAARQLGTTPDALRNWERNGLLKIPRAPNGYRLFSSREMRRASVILTLVRAGYGLMAILRMVTTLDSGNQQAARAAIDAPTPDDDITHATNTWLSTLRERLTAARQAELIIGQMGLSSPRGREPNSHEALG